MEEIYAKSIVSSYSERGWFGSNHNMNIYKGCNHGCVYCDSRSRCYGVEDFDRVRLKADALNIINKDLSSRRKRGIVITGSMSDAYNSHEKDLELIRSALQMIDKYRYGIVIDTKSDLVLRDADILKSIQKHSPAVVNFTITTADDTMCRRIERGVCPSSQRFAAIRSLTDQGIACGVLLMPILPFINDTEENIRAIVEGAREAGAKWIYTAHHMGMTLRDNQREYYYDWLDKEFPGLREKYIRTFQNSYECSSSKEKDLLALFYHLCGKYQMRYKMRDIIREIRGETFEQLTLF